MALARLIPGSNKQIDPNINVITTRVKQKVRHREYLLIWQLFVRYTISYEKRKQ